MQPIVRANRNGAEHTERSLKDFKDFIKGFLLKEEKMNLQGSLSIQVNRNRESKEGLILLTFLVLEIRIKVLKRKQSYLINLPQISFPFQVTTEIMG